MNAWYQTWLTEWFTIVHADDPLRLEQYLLSKPIWVRWWLQRSVDHGRTPLVWAILHGQTAVLAILLQPWSMPALDLKDGPTGYTPIELVSYTVPRSLPILRLLLGAGCRNYRCVMPHLAHEWPAGLALVLEHDPSVVRLRDPQTGDPLVHSAAMASDPGSLQLLQARGGDLCQTDAMGHGPLIAALRSKCPRASTVQWLLDNTANRPTAWVTALACEIGHRPHSDLVIAAVPRAELPTVLALTLSSVVLGSVDCGRSTVSQRLLFDRCSVTVLNRVHGHRRLTPLERALARGHGDVIVDLLARGAVYGDVSQGGLGLGVLVRFYHFVRRAQAPSALLLSSFVLVSEMVWALLCLDPTVPRLMLTVDLGCVHRVRSGLADLLPSTLEYDPFRLALRRVSADVARLIPGGAPGRPVSLLAFRAGLGPDVTVEYLHWHTEAFIDFHGPYADPEFIMELGACFPQRLSRRLRRTSIRA